MFLCKLSEERTGEEDISITVLDVLSHKYACFIFVENLTLHCSTAEMHDSVTSQTTKNVPASLEFGPQIPAIE